MNNKKLFRLAFVLCASILMAVSCTKKDDNPTNPELPSMGTLTATPQSVFLSLESSGATGTEQSAEIQVSGFSDNFKSEVKSKTDITYKVKTVEVKGITTTGPAAKDVDALKKAVTNTTFKVETQDTFDKIKIGFAGTEAEKNAKAIATAITSGKTATITLTVEASPAGNTEGKYSSSTFEVRLGIQVS